MGGWGDGGGGGRAGPRWTGPAVGHQSSLSLLASPGLPLTAIHCHSPPPPTRSLRLSSTKSKKLGDPRLSAGGEKGQEANSKLVRILLGSTSSPALAGQNCGLVPGQVPVEFQGCRSHPGLAPLLFGLSPLQVCASHLPTSRTPNLHPPHSSSSYR